MYSRMKIDIHRGQVQWNLGISQHTIVHVPAAYNLIQSNLTQSNSTSTTYIIIMSNMDPIQPNPAYWCKFEAVDPTSFIIVSSVIFAQCCLLCLFFRSLTIRVHNSLQISNDESMLFRLMGVWFLIAFTKSIINILVYPIYENDPDYVNAQSQIVLSAICLFLDKMGSFSLHTILIRIPCLWITNTVARLKDQELNLQQRKRISKVFSILKILKLYMRVRIIIVFINLGFDIWMIVSPDIGKHSKYLTMITMVEAGVAIFVYTFGIVSLFKFKDLLDFPKEIKKRVILEYALLMFCCMSRLIFNFLYYFHFSLKDYKPGPNCHDTQDSSYIGYIYLSFGYTVMHIMPIATIILIYWPDIENNQVRGSILSIQDISDLKNRLLCSANIRYLLGSGQVQTSAQDVQQEEEEQHQQEHKQKSTKKQRNGNSGQFRVYYDK